MESLNDDTIILILSYLDLKSQQACMIADRRFYHLMPFVWSTQYNTVHMSLYEANFSIEHLDHFFESIRKTVKEIRLRLMTAAEFHVITSKVYPKVYDFRFGTDVSNELTDADMRKIVISFPNLTTFSPRGKFSGQYFTGFPLLERVTLTYCTDFCLANVVKIMKACKLKEIKLCISEERFYQSINLKLTSECVKHLEIIKIDFNELPWFEEHLKDLENLKELTLCGFGDYLTLKDVLKKLGRMTDRRHFKIVETCNSTDTLETITKSGIHIDALKIVSDNYLFQDLGYFHSHYFENIHELYFKDCVIEERHSLDSLMNSLDFVNIISFEQCMFSFRKYIFEVSKIVPYRNKPLHVNLFENINQDKSRWVYFLDAVSVWFILDEGRNYEYAYETIHLKF